MLRRSKELEEIGLGARDLPNPSSPSSPAQRASRVNNLVSLPWTRLHIWGDAARNAHSFPDRHYQAGKDLSA